MKFEEWAKKNTGRPYSEILNELLEFDDQQKFKEWCFVQRIETHTADWAMLAFYVFDLRLKELEKKKEKKND
jgi:hypothetical protein